MSKLNEEVSRVVEKNHLIFRRLMVLNFVTLLIIFSVSGVFLYKYMSGISTREVKRTFRSVEGLVLESVYSYEKLGSTFEVYKNIAKERLQAAYQANNVAAHIDIAPCAAENQPPHDIIFKLKIATDPLINCVYVKDENRILSKLISYLVFAFLLALALPAVFWQFYKRRLNERVLLPILKDLEERRVDAAMGDLAQHVAHDIRSPLAALELVANMNVNVSREESSKLIKQSIIRIREIANGILEKSKLLRSDAAPKSVSSIPENSNIKMLVGNVVDEVKLVTSENGCVTFKTEISSELPVKNVSVWNSLSRVLTNLITNAAESTHYKNGLVEIRTVQENGSLKITIKDNGEGIDATALSHIGKKGWTSKKNGNGLGIFKAKEFVKQHGGEISYQSIPGKGTECLLQLPHRALE
jgi:signal transduction histidine kinase